MFSNNKIIIVEDNEINQYFLKTILKSTNINITMCYESRDFFEKFDDTYDLILLDIMIPGELSGIDILRKIRETNKEIPIIMQSAYTEKYKECKENGADDFISKPITYTSLLDHLKKFLTNES